MSCLCFTSYFRPYVLAGLILAMSSCNHAPTVVASNSSEAERVYEKEWEEAPFTLISAHIQGDSLIAVVSYSGGCSEHKLSLASRGPMLKSLPPKQLLRVLHQSPGDPCRSIIQDTLISPLTSFRGTPRGTTVLVLEGWSENLFYSYP